MSDLRFTDENLKQLKEKVDKTSGFYLRDGKNEPIDIKALLARMEAAEKVASQIFTGCDLADYEAWRKSAGK